MAEKRKWSK